jgi:hypothetical protein
MKTKRNSSMRALALQITFILLLALSLTLDAAAAKNRFERKPAGTGVTLQNPYDRAAASELLDRSWVPTGSMGTGRALHTATLLSSGKVLVAGGDNLGYLSSAELYDPSSGTWTATGSMSAARYSCTATLLPSGKVLVVGGSSDGIHILSSAELYDPATGMWTATGSMNLARAYHTATLLPSGKVLERGLGRAAWAARVFITRRRCCPQARCLSRGELT